MLEHRERYRIGQLAAAFADVRPQFGRFRVDLRSLSPIDFGTLEESVRKTGRLVVAHEAPVFGGLGAEIAARVAERCFYHLEAPVRRVGAFATPYPPSRLEKHFLPDADRILHEVDKCLEV